MVFRRKCLPSIPDDILDFMYEPSATVRKQSMRARVTTVQSYDFMNNMPRGGGALLIHIVPTVRKCSQISSGCAALCVLNCEIPSRLYVHKGANPHRQIAEYSDQRSLTTNSDGRFDVTVSAQRRLSFAIARELDSIGQPRTCRN